MVAFCIKFSVIKVKYEQTQYSYIYIFFPPLFLWAKKYLDYMICIKVHFQVFSSGTLICMSSLICQVLSAREVSECSLLPPFYEVSSIYFVLVLSFDYWSLENTVAPFLHFRSVSVPLRLLERALLWSPAPSSWGPPPPSDLPDSSTSHSCCTSGTSCTKLFASGF